MGFEDAVRKRHAFEQALRELLSFVTAMTREEIELSMGRVADGISHAEDQLVRAHEMLKGQLLATYLSLRNQGRHQQSRFRRFAFRGAMKRHFEDRGTAKHAAAIGMHNENVLRVQAERDALMEAHQDALKGWELRVSKLPLLRRLFYKPPRPAYPSLPFPPAPPLGPDAFVADSRREANMTEFLITSVAQFRLVAIPPDQSGVSPETVLLLAN